MLFTDEYIGFVVKPGGTQKEKKKSLTGDEKQSKVVDG